MAMEIFTNPIVYGGLCFTLGALVSGFIAHILTKDRDRHNRKNNTTIDAFRKFRAVIAKEIADTSIYPDANRLSTIHAAIIEIKPHLTPAEQKQINETWQKLNNLEHTRTAQAAFYGHSMGASIRKELLQSFLACIENHENNLR
jgi:hypothetical protein